MMSKWISVNILIYSKDWVVRYGWYTAGQGWYYCYHDGDRFIHISGKDITHWMPLSELPIRSMTDEEQRIYNEMLNNDSIKTGVNIKI